ncbi:MAG: lipid-A-disaccharide synthase [Candidatus Aminicenantes bacterium RBG_13_63_10]|nr:MAG: lipid-A-disaccharide synthase [Candidatus Aminicenantes bacterium RBG_13_63_10]
MSSLLIVAGESSGDKHGARLVREFLERHPNETFFGVGGPRLAEAGAEILVPMKELAVMGIFEVAARLFRLRQVFRRLRHAASERRPRAAVLIDSPDFNLRLAKRLKALGIPVLYYISPTVWAWRKGRLKTIRKYVDRMLLIFPFEKEIYRRAAIPAVYVGHPLMESVRSGLTRTEFFVKHGLDPRRKLITLLPGSRTGEVRRHLPVIVKTIPLLREAFGAQFVLVAADGLDRTGLSRLLAGAPAEDLRLLSQDGYEAMAASDLVLSACGTANLEAALLGVPFVAFYRISPLTYTLGRKLVKISHYSIVNILAGRPVVAELIQRRLTPENLVREARAILDSPKRQAELQAEFRKLHDLLGNEPASVRAAQELETLLAGVPSAKRADEPRLT